MKMSIRAIRHPGDPEKERLVLDVLQECNVGDHVVLCSKVPRPNAATAGEADAYWFRDEQVTAGDMIVLYTKHGKARRLKRDDGSTAYFFYWGLASPAWALLQNGAVLAEIRDWVAMGQEDQGDEETGV